MRSQCLYHLPPHGDSFHNNFNIIFIRLTIVNLTLIAAAFIDHFFAAFINKNRLFFLFRQSSIFIVAANSQIFSKESMENLFEVLF